MPPKLDAKIQEAAQSILDIFYTGPEAVEGFPRRAATTEYVDSALDAAGDLHCEGDAGETNDIIEAFLKALVKET
jgi:hypothetical protein